MKKKKLLLSNVTTGPIYKKQVNKKPAKFEKWGTHVCFFESEKSMSVILEVRNTYLLVKGCHGGKCARVLFRSRSYELQAPN